jgi:hypothetical protein
MNLSDELLNHQLNLQIYGIYVPDMGTFADAYGNRMFREFRLQFSSHYEPFDPVSMKLAVKPSIETPYSFQNNQLLYKNKEVSFLGVQIYRVPLPLDEDNWHLKGYTFPFRGSRNPYRELRINLRISGHCPGRCFFCHRVHSHRIKQKKSKTFNSTALIRAIKLTEGQDILEKVSRIMFISELYGNEGIFLEDVKNTAEVLRKEGFSHLKEFNCCGTDVRSLDGLKKLREIVNPDRFSFSLEFFRNRDRWMGRYKGIPMEKVYEILNNARKAGFKEIQLNYLAGIDSLEECEKGFSVLSNYGLVDSIGLSTFTIFVEDEYQYRLSNAWHVQYYQNLVQILNTFNLKTYYPESYDMGCPYAVLMERIDG